MVKGSRIVKEESDFRKKIIVVTLDVKELGSLFALHDVLPSYINKYEKMYRNNEKKQLIIEGSSLSDIKTGMRKWGKGMATGGHGGYRFNYSVKERIIGLYEDISNEFQRKYQDRIDELVKENNILRKKLNNSSA